MLILLAYNDTKIVIFGIFFFRDAFVDFYNINIYTGIITVKGRIIMFNMLIMF